MTQYNKQLSSLKIQIGFNLPDKMFTSYEVEQYLNRLLNSLDHRIYDYLCQIAKNPAILDDYKNEDKNNAL